MAIYFQVLCTVAIAFTNMNINIINAWPSSTVLLFQSVNTTLSRPMTEIEISLLGSLPAVGSLIGNLVAGLILDRFGRKRTSILGSALIVILLFYASIGASTCCLVIGAQILTGWGPTWIVPIFVYIYTVFYTLGAGTVPFVFLSEIFMPQVKSILSMLAVELAWLCSSTSLFIFPPVVTAVGLGPVFLCFAGVCAGTAVFCHYCLPETKGLSLDAIQDVFARNRRFN